MFGKRISRALNSILELMNHDFCPGLNRYVNWLKQPIGWVIGGALFSLLVGIFVGPQGYLLMWALLSFLVLGSVWPWLSMKGLGCKLKLVASRTEEGRPTTMILSVTNRWPVPAFGLMVRGNFLQDVNSEDDVVAVGLKRVPGWSVSTFEWTVTPPRRGKLPTEAPELANGFPFGLYTAVKPVEIEGSTLVWPKRTSLDGTLDIDGFQFNIDGLASDRQGNDGDTIGVREYRHGDAIKNIHWVHTARCNRLIVRERQTVSQMPIRVILDLSTENHFGTGSQSTYESAIRLAGSVCSSLHALHARIELECLGLPNGVESRTCNRKGSKTLLDFLALLPEFAPADTASLQAVAKPLRLQLEKQFVIFIHSTKLKPAPAELRLFKSVCIDDIEIETTSFEELFAATSVRKTFTGSTIAATAMRNTHQIDGGQHAVI